MLYSFHQETNANVKSLNDLMEEHVLIAADTRSKKARKKLWTWLSPPDSNHATHRQHIDFIMIRRKWSNGIKNAQAYNSFASVGSDNRVVLAKMRLSLRAQMQKIEEG